jgi:hypothetical protein
MLFIHKHQDKIISFFSEISKSTSSEENIVELNKLLILNRQILLILKPLYITLTFFEGNHVSLNDAFPILRHLFHHMKKLILDKKIDDVKKIGEFLCNEIYVNTLGKDYTLYFQSAFALSKEGREEERLKLGLITEISSGESGKILDYESVNNTAESNLSTFIKQQTESIGEMEEIDSDNSGDFVYSQRNSEILQDIKRREPSKRIKNKILVNEVKEESFFFFYLYREEFLLNLNKICEEIYNFNLKIAVDELLIILWEKLYPNENENVISKVYNVFCDYWNEDINEFPFIKHLHNLSSVEFWKIVKSNSLDKVYTLAADFALRFICARISSCAVERIFSHIKWLLGTKRYKLSKETLENLLILKRKKYN